MTAKPFTARPYQHAIIEHILDNPRCGVYAGMGMGKTSSTLTALEILEMLEPGPTLVIAPLRVASTTWPDEIRKWEHLQNLKVSTIIGTSKEREEALRKKADIYTINYENLPWLVEYLGKKWFFKKVVADESTKLKGFRVSQGSKRAKALGKVAHKYV